MATPLAPRIQEHELTLLVLEYLQDNVAKFPKSLECFKTESASILQNIAPRKKVKSLEIIMNEYFRLLHFEATNRAFVSQHATRLQPYLKNTLVNLTKFLGHYKTIRDVRDSLQQQHHVYPNQYVIGSSGSSGSSNNSIRRSNFIHHGQHDQHQEDDFRNDSSRHHEKALRAARVAIQQSSNNNNNNNNNNTYPTTTEPLTHQSQNQLTSIRRNSSNNSSSSRRKRKDKPPQQWRNSPKKKSRKSNHLNNNSTTPSSSTSSTNDNDIFNILNSMPIDQINKDNFIQSFINQAPQLATIINNQLTQQQQDIDGSSSNINNEISDTDAHELIEILDEDSIQQSNDTNSTHADAIMNTPGLANVIRTTFTNAIVHKNNSDGNSIDDSPNLISPLSSTPINSTTTTTTAINNDGSNENPFDIDFDKVTQHVNNTKK